jgi:hypothetical protein
MERALWRCGGGTVTLLKEFARRTLVNSCCHGIGTMSLTGEADRFDLDVLRNWVLKLLCDVGWGVGSVFKGLGLLAALSKSKAASIALLLDSRSGKPLSMPLREAGSNPNNVSSLTDPRSWFSQSSDVYPNGIMWLSL